MGGFFVSTLLQAILLLLRVSGSRLSQELIKLDLESSEARLYGGGRLLASITKAVS